MNFKHLFHVKYGDCRCLLSGYGARVQSVRVQLYSAAKNRCARNRRVRDYSTHHQWLPTHPLNGSRDT